jgi:hypothetical protein
MDMSTEPEKIHPGDMFALLTDNRSNKIVDIIVGFGGRPEVTLVDGKAYEQTITVPARTEIGIKWAQQLEKRTSQEPLADPTGYPI